MFSELEEFLVENAPSVNTVKKSITSHIQAPLERFNKHLPEETASFTITTASHMMTDLEDVLIELSTD